MSQRDLIAEIRAAPPAAPAALRERVRAIAATAPDEAPAESLSPLLQLFSGRRLLRAAVPAAIAAAATVVLSLVFTRDHGTTRSADSASAVAPKLAPSRAAGVAPSAKSAGPQEAAPLSATLAVQVATPAKVSAVAHRAQLIATSLGGTANSVRIDTGAHSGSATVVLHVPPARAREALTRLVRLGTVTSEQASAKGGNGTVRFSVSTPPGR
jgi:hypothetical protein